MTNIPNVTFAFREGDEPPMEGGGCPIGGEFVFKTTQDLFSNKRVIIFSLPGAFTPTCSTYQLPGFEELYPDFKAQGIDEIYCISVNDAFVMNEWARHLNIKNVKVLPDGNGDFTRMMGMLVNKTSIGFGPRSHRYAAVVNDNKIEKMFEEPGREDNHPADPYGESSPENVMKYLQEPV
jgi:alkyl hydroperoxide reductase subunit AhpC